MMRIAKDSTHYTWLAWLTILVISPLESVLAQSEHGPSQLVLHLVDRVGLPDKACRFMGAEIEKSFKRTGVEILITVFEAHDPAAPLPEGDAVRVHLWPRDGTFLQTSPMAMGAVRLQNGHELESAHVFVPVVVQTLTRGRGSVADLTNLELGRGLGRVVAHELIHAVATRLPHSRHGLMHHGMTTEFLRSRRPATLDRFTVEAFTRGLNARPQLAARR